MDFLNKAKEAVAKLAGDGNDAPATPATRKKALEEYSQDELVAVCRRQSLKLKVLAQEMESLRATRRDSGECGTEWWVGGGGEGGGGGGGVSSLTIIPCEGSRGALWSLGVGERVEKEVVKGH